jgi:4-amino-4-deoxy-L-arabinose transferase-like glycosyltransferase
MKPVCLAVSVILLAAFALYALGGGRLQGPADKAVQLVLLVPAAFLFALAFRDWSAPSRAIRSILGGGGEVRFTLLLPLFLAGVTAWMAYGPLEGIPKGGDEAAYLIQSRVYARGMAWAPEPAVSNPRDLFPFRHFIFDRGRWFVMYTPIHALLMVPFTRVGLNALMGPLQGALSLAGAYLLFRMLAGRATARLGALVMAASPFFLFMASTHMAHNSELLFVTWALFFLVRAVQNDGKSSYGVAGFLLGLALCAKPYTLLPWALSIGLVLFARLKAGALKALLFISLGALAPVAFFLWSNALYTGDPMSPAYNLARGGSLLGFGPDRAWFPEYGDHAHTPLRGLLNIVKQAGAGSTILLGWPFLSLVPPLLVLLNRAERRKWKALFLPIIAVVPFMFIHYAAAIDYGPRHYYTTLPAFALLCALGMREAVRRWGNTAVLFIAALFVLNTFMVYIPDGIAIRSGPWQTIDGIPSRLAAANATPPAVVFMEAGEHGYPNIMSGLLATDPFLDGDIVFCAHQTPGEDMAAMEAVFPGRNPYLFYMEGDRGLIEPWTPERAAALVPERDLRPPWAPENVGNRRAGVLP